MSYLIRMLKKQIQLIEIEIGDYRIAKNQGLKPLHPESYYVGLAHAYRGLRLAILSLEKGKEEINVH